MVKFSIVVPVFNTRIDWLEKCIESANTSKDTEILIIDDGSNDSMANYIDELKTKWGVRVFHQENHGVSVARNVGINEAKGNYVLFIDSDDYYGSLQIYHIDELCLKNNLVLGRIAFNKDDIIKKINYTGDVTTLDVGAAMLAVFSYYPPYKNLFFNTVWGKIYDLSLIRRNQLFFEPDMSRMEDGLFNIKYLQYCNNIVTSENFEYVYRIHEGSMVRSYKESLGRDLLFTFEHIYEYVQNDRKLIVPFYYKTFMLSTEYIDKLFMTTMKENRRKQLFYEYINQKIICQAFKELKGKDIIEMSLRKVFYLYKWRKYWIVAPYCRLKFITKNIK